MVLQALLLFSFLSFKLCHYNLEAVQLVTLRQISPKRIWQPSTLWSDCIRLSTAKERNILTGEIALEHIKVSVQICGIWKAPSPFPHCMQFATSHCLFQMVCWVHFSFIPRELELTSICYAIFLVILKWLIYQCQLINGTERGPP